MRRKSNRFFTKTKAACLLALAVCLGSFGGTWAYYGNSIEIVNPLSASHSGVIMAEEFNPNDSFLPGETVTKKIWFENTGKMDLFLRVEVPPVEEWADEPSLDTGYVIKRWTSAWTTKKEEKKIDDLEEPKQNFEEWGSTDLWSKVFSQTDNSGVTHNYRYYRKILPAGESTEAILESIKLSPEVSNDRHGDDYSGKEYRLEFSAQAIPAEKNSGVEEGESQGLGVQALWGINVSRNEGTGVLTWSEIK